MTHLDDFKRFHKENPRVWDLFKAFTMQLIAAGRTRYSSDAVIHRIRWYTTVETTGPVFKINDHYSSLYARLFHIAHSEYGKVFETRQLSDGQNVDAELRKLL